MQIAGIVASLGLGLIGASKEREAHERAADEQRAIAERNAQREEAETMEKVRQAEEDKRLAAASARAGAGASGAMLSGSNVGYIGALEESRQKEIDWLKRSGKSRADITKATGEMAAQTSEARGSAAWWGGVGSGVQSAISFL